MSFSFDFWIYDLMCLSLGIMLFNAAVTGKLYSSGRGRRVLGARLKAAPLRAVLFVLSVGIFAFVIWLTRHHIIVHRMMK
jgi:hypothetical protein